MARPTRLQTICACCVPLRINGRCCTRRRAEEGEFWIGQLRLLFETAVNRKPRRLALVRWYEQLPDDKLRPLETLVRMSVWRWATITRDGKRRNHYDVIDADRIVGPVLLQGNPLRSARQHFFMNHFVLRGLE